MGWGWQKGSDLAAIAALRIRRELVRGEWNKDFLDEVELFPFGPHEDIVDAASLVLAKLGWVPTSEPQWPDGPFTEGYRDPIRRW
jgi:hypothetical protein